MMVKIQDGPPKQVEPTAVIAEVKSEDNTSSKVSEVNEPILPLQIEERPFIDKLSELNFKINVINKAFYISEREELRKSKSEAIRKEMRELLEERRREAEE